MLNSLLDYNKTVYKMSAKGSELKRVRQSRKANTRNRYYKSLKRSYPERQLARIILY